MEKIYLVKQTSGTFGQTDAGYHTTTGDEQIVAQAFACRSNDHPEGWRQANAEQERFLKEAKLSLSVRVTGAAYPQEVDFPIDPCHPASFQKVIDFLRKRSNKDAAYLRSRELNCWVELAEEGRECKKGATTLDAENLAYQRELLRG